LPRRVLADPPVNVRGSFAPFASFAVELHYSGSLEERREGSKSVLGHAGGLNTTGVEGGPDARKVLTVRGD